LRRFERKKSIGRDGLAGGLPVAEAISPAGKIIPGAAAAFLRARVDLAVFSSSGIRGEGGDT
jgi:hypothetical protein